MSFSESLDLRQWARQRQEGKMMASRPSYSA